MLEPDLRRDFCRHALQALGHEGCRNPLALATLLRERFEIDATPSLAESIAIVCTLGIQLRAVKHLSTGGYNMWARGGWHIHYAAQDPVGTQKFDLFHELYEVLAKTIHEIDSSFPEPREPSLSRDADRFAAGVLLPPVFLGEQMAESGCDAVLLGEAMELSHQALLVGFAQRMPRTPFAAVLYDRVSTEQQDPRVEDFVAQLVVRTPPVRWLRKLCPAQHLTASRGRATPGSLVCLAVTSNQPILCRPDGAARKGAAGALATLVRPLPRRGVEPGRVILLSLPERDLRLIEPQVRRLQPLEVPWHEAIPCRDSLGFPRCSICRYTGTGADEGLPAGRRGVEDGNPFP